MTLRTRSLSLLRRPVALGLIMGVFAGWPTCGVGAENPGRRFTAEQAFRYDQTLIFQDDFHSGEFGRWEFSENASYNMAKPRPERLAIVAAPGLDADHKAIRFVVPRGPNSFRSEVSLPHEAGAHERWYGERIFIPEDWVIDDAKGDDIVMQWHAIPGNWRATFPNLSISINGNKWWIKQNFGTAQTGPTRTATALTDPVQPGRWVSIVVHAKWSQTADGLLQIWKDGKQVVEKAGPNLYTTIGVEYTPYFKTGIYHPTWHLKAPEAEAAFAEAKPLATTKVVYVTDVKIGNEHARYRDIASPTPVASDR
jgi:hypothetical protein